MVLVVDDCNDSRDSFAGYLRYAGFNVAEATNGSEALEAARALRPDVILMDMHMPVMDGWEAIRRLKSGLAEVRAKYSQLFSVSEETWDGDRLQFRISALGQAVSGTIDVAEDSVRLEIFLPWLLAKVVETLQPLIRREGTLLLEKK